MRQSLTILFPPLDAIGHVNSSIGVAQVLRERGHRIIFAINDQWRGRLKVYGFEEELLTDPERDPDVDPAKQWTEMMTKMGALMALSPMEKMKLVGANGLTDIMNKTRNTDHLLAEILIRCKPDIIVIDNIFVSPQILKSNIPWVMSWSMNPLALHYKNENLPPSGLGFPAIGDKKEWQEIRDFQRQFFRQFIDAYNEWLEEYKCERIVSDTIWLPQSPFLNIYDFPKELDYDYELPPNYQRFDSFMRTDNTSQFEVPEKLRNKSGKLIYFSLGSMGSGDVNLMKRLVSILAKSQHKFIVSKGQLHDQYSLAHNMWGEKTVPQTKVLPLVDLVVTHGGNNTVTESFYFGKPMIVMPLFGDQYDNAQRIHETGYGIRLDPYNCSETELLEAIENLMNDTKLEIKMNKISKRIQSSNSLERVAEMIEKLLK